MIIKQISSSFSVSDQMTPDDVDVLAAKGVRTLICNRPDGEAAGQPSFADISERAAQHGIAMRYQPVVHDTINSHNVRQFAAELQNGAPVHAWCRSGLRSVTLWSLAQLQQQGDADSLVAQATAQGFDFASFKQKFAGVISELNDSLLQLPLASHCPVLIVGAGAAGIALAASLLRRDGLLRITLVDPADTHYYQPGFTLIGAGEFSSEEVQRPTRTLIPPGVTWIQSAVTHFLPEHSQVVLANGTRLGYDRLCVCPGLKLDWAAIPGLVDTLGKNGVTSNYRHDLAAYTWQLVQSLRKGRALFTQPPMPIKCAGAPQKALYLSANQWERNGTLKDISVEFYNTGAVLFGVKEYVPALQRYIERYRAKTNFGHTLVKVDGPAQLATFVTTDKDGKATTVEVTFDLLHVVPPQCAPDFIRNSPLADRAGWVDVDKHTLRHKLFANVWGLGDCMNAPNAKTMAAARKQVVVVADNLLHDLHRQPQQNTYAGYGACPLTVERGRVVLAEFGYDGVLQPTLPLALIDGRKPTWFGWVLKKNLMPWIYWHLMLKGREWLTGSKRS